MMNLTKALKKKKKIIGEVSTYQNRLFQNNVYEEGQEPPYDAKVALDKYISATNELVELKTKIHLANAPIYNLIFRLGELKSLASRLKGLNTRDGKVKGYNQEPSIMVASIGTIQRDNMVSAYEEEIERLQEEIETFNATTMI